MGPELFQDSVHPGGTKAWIALRVSLLWMLVCTLWALLAMVPQVGRLFRGASSFSQSFRHWITTPMHSLCILVWLWTTVHHASLCLHLMIEDYISIPWRRALCKALVQGVSWTMLGAAGVSLFFLWKIP